jgi:hypothetical protein
MCFALLSKNTSIKEGYKTVQCFRLMIQDGFGICMINGFAHLKTPVLVDETPDIISTNFSWGLIRPGQG